MRWVGVTDILDELLTQMYSLEIFAAIWVGIGVGPCYNSCPLPIGIF